MRLLLKIKAKLFLNCTIKWNIALPVQFMQELLELGAAKRGKSELRRKDLLENQGQ